jgi:hypothetical protein
VSKLSKEDRLLYEALCGATNARGTSLNLYATLAASYGTGASAKGESGGDASSKDEAIVNPNLTSMLLTKPVCSMRLTKPLCY